MEMAMGKKTAAKTQQTKPLTWPNGKKVAVSVTVMFETWPDDSAPSYSVQTSHLKKGTVDHAAKAWSTYGGRVGVWRLMRTLERMGIPATFFVNARCTEQYPDAIKQIVKSGFDIAAHSYTQDDLPAYCTPQEQGALIRRSVQLLEACGGKKVTGWASPVVAFTPETAGLLKQAGLSWTCDVTYADLPIKIHTPYGPIAGVPTTDFSDNRVLRASSRDFFDVHRGMFDYLRKYESIGLQTLVIHCQFGGRPLITAMLTELLQYMAKSRDAWFTTHAVLADWALKQNVDEHTYQSRYFGAPSRTHRR
jgi:peptidoglycan/xylan/chitin deacetylase (PgdA/CDA1 family)